MVTVPPALLDILRLEPGAEVGMVIERGRLVIQPQQRRRYTLSQLLAQCEPKARRSVEDREWVKSKRAGRELL